jgi:hypothetical protein
MKTSKVVLVLIFLSVFSHIGNAQDENITEKIDALTIEWDKTALQIETYEGLKEFCQEKVFRDKAIRLLDDIHHYDSLLFSIVKEKYDTDGNSEAKKTLDDIVELESEYTPRNFLTFLRTECITVNDIELNKSSDRYNHDTKKLEKEANKYVLGITAQIDLIDEHVHHLNGL